MPQELEILCNSRPLDAYIQFLNGLADSLFESGDGFVDLPELPLEIARVEQDNSSTVAGKTVITLYPSDSFLCFGAAVFALHEKRLLV